MNWSKSYIYAGSRLLSTITKSGSSELTEYHHPDRLGTKLVTDTTANTAKSQATLPFGALISAETQATTNQKFTSYDRSGATGLDYAVNRTYNSGQSRFTQVDPIGMASASIGDPQSLNMFAYTQNNPVDFIDPSGLFLAAPEDDGGVIVIDTWIWGWWVNYWDNYWSPQNGYESGDTGRRGPPDDEEPGGGGSGIEKAAKAAKKFLKNNKRCKAFLDKILQEVNTSSPLATAVIGSDRNGRALLGRLDSNQALDLVLGAEVIKTGKSGVSRNGSTITTNSLSASADPSRIYVQNSFSSSSSSDKSFAVIHESFHLLTGVTDIEIARAARAVAKKKPKSFTDSRKASIEFNNIVKRRCAGLTTSNEKVFKLGR